MLWHSDSLRVVMLPHNTVFKSYWLAKHNTTPHRAVVQRLHDVLKLICDLCGWNVCVAHLFHFDFVRLCLLLYSATPYDFNWYSNLIVALAELFVCKRIQYNICSLYFSTIYKLGLQLTTMLIYDSSGVSVTSHLKPTFDVF